MIARLPDRAVVAGLGVSGPSVVRALLSRGVRVVAVDGSAGPAQSAAASELSGLGADVRLGPDAVSGLPETDLVVTSPGWRPDSPLLAAAAARGVPVWGDVELAWRLRPEPAAPWLAVTGTNGKTTTVRMLASILSAAGLRTVAAGNVGLPVLDAVLAPVPYDVLAVELSSYQLHWSSSLACQAGAVLNLAPDHLDWHGSMTAYAADKAKIWRGVERAVCNADDPLLADLVLGAPSPVAFTLGEPADGQLGVVSGALVDRTGGAPVELCAVSDVDPPAPHNLANALAAAALALALPASYAVGPSAVRDGLRAWRPDPHRIALVASSGGVDWVDDSKATNPHAAAASLAAYPSVVWIAGGLAKGATFDELVAGARDRLRAVVLLGRERQLIREALATHAPDVPVADIDEPDGAGEAAVTRAVAAAGAYARPGDTVLLAPACASMDQFANYGARGDAFAVAVRRYLRP